MRTILISLILTALLYAQPFQKGVNLTMWFQANAAQQIPFNRYDKTDFEHIKQLGCDVIRLPINLHAMTSGAPDYTLDPLFLTFLDQAIDWAEELNLHLILDNHSFDPSSATSPTIDEVLVPVWTQMAEHFKNRSKLIYYEVLNEPHGINDNLWNDIQQKVIDAIRSVDSVHTIIVGPASWNSYNNLHLMPQYADTNLIYTFHFYDPFVFTHQGASWVEPSMVSLSGVPFPYISSRMPDCPPDLQGTWINDALNNYPNEGTIGAVREKIDIAAQFKNDRNVKIFCGEFGVYMLNSPPTDRVFWYQIVRSYFEDKGIPWTAWDYQGGFGLFKKNSNELFDYDLNIDLLQALGLNVPPQKTFVKRPDSTGFYLYHNGFAKDIFPSGQSSGGTLEFYHNKGSDDLCIYWSDATQYSVIEFDFRPNRDFSRLVNDDFVLELWYRGNPANKRIEVRFLDSKTDENDHPWRMAYTLQEPEVTWDDNWHNIRIPLKQFKETGSWDNGWFNPQGKFDWTDVDRFQIVAEYQDLTGEQYWFDDIQIAPLAVGINPNKEPIVRKMNLLTNYPNPFNNQTRIAFTVAKSSKVWLKIADINGRLVRTLISGKSFTPGKHQIWWNGQDDLGRVLPSGEYFSILKTKKQRTVHKLLLIR